MLVFLVKLPKKDKTTSFTRGNEESDFALLLLGYFIFNTHFYFMQFFKVLIVLVADKEHSNMNFFTISIVSLNYVSFSIIITIRCDDKTLCSK